MEIKKVTIMGLITILHEASHFCLQAENLCPNIVKNINGAELSDACCDAMLGLGSILQDEKDKKPTEERKQNEN